jgi:hypothetical protein
MINRRPLSNRELGNLEIEILHGLREGGDGATVAYATWQGPEGIEMGPMRYAISTKDGRVYSVSPFSGAWTYVKEVDILRVRSLAAMSA